MKIIFFVHQKYLTIIRVDILKLLTTLNSENNIKHFIQSTFNHTIPILSITIIIFFIRNTQNIYFFNYLFIKIHYSYSCFIITKLNNFFVSI